MSHSIPSVIFQPLSLGTMQYSVWTLRKRKSMKCRYLWNVHFKKTSVYLLEDNLSSLTERQAHMHTHSRHIAAWMCSAIFHSSSNLRTTLWCQMPLQQCLREIKMETQIAAWWVSDIGAFLSKALGTLGLWLQRAAAAPWSWNTA